MEQTSFYHMKFTGPENEQFRPPDTLRNAHLQTMLPRLLRRRITFAPHWQRLDLPDGDFVDLAWSEDPQLAQHKPRVVLFHGLEGSFQSPYIHGLMAICRARGWLAGSSDAFSRLQRRSCARRRWPDWSG